MPKFENIGDWVEKKYGGQRQAAKAMGTTQGVVSQWINGRSVPGPKKQALMVKNDYDGPFPEPKKKMKGGVSREDFDRWTGRVDGLLEERKKEIGNLRRRLGEAFVLIQDLGHRAGIELPPVEPVE